MSDANFREAANQIRSDAANRIRELRNARASRRRAAVRRTSAAVEQVDTPVAAAPEAVEDLAPVAEAPEIAAESVDIQPEDIPAPKPRRRKKTSAAPRTRKKKAPAPAPEESPDAEEEDAAEELVAEPTASEEPPIVTEEIVETVSDSSVELAAPPEDAPAAATEAETKKKPANKAERPKRAKRAPRAKKAAAKPQPPRRPAMAGSAGGIVDLDILPGIGAGLRWRLGQLGIESANDLATSDVNELRTQLGEIGQLLNMDYWVDLAKEKVADPDD